MSQDNFSSSRYETYLKYKQIYLLRISIYKFDISRAILTYTLPFSGNLGSTMLVPGTNQVFWLNIFHTTHINRSWSHSIPPVHSAWRLLRHYSSFATWSIVVSRCQISLCWCCVVEGRVCCHASWHPKVAEVQGKVFWVWTGTLLCTFWLDRLSGCQLIGPWQEHAVNDDRTWCSWRNAGYHHLEALPVTEWYPFWDLCSSCACYLPNKKSVFQAWDLIR